MCAETTHLLSSKQVKNKRLRNIVIVTRTCRTCKSRHKLMEQLNTQLLLGARYGDEDKVLNCLERGADINCTGYNVFTDVTPLHWAASNAHFKIVKILVDNGADLNVSDKRGRTPLHWAVMYGNDSNKKYHVNSDGKLIASDNRGSIPLQFAFKERKNNTIDILVDAGCDLFATDDKGKSPLDYASSELKVSQKMVNVETEFRAKFPQIADKREFHRLLSSGFYFSYHNRVYLAGACNVGKSTLASILIGIAISKDWNSTDGLKIYFGKNGIDLKKKEMVMLSEALQGSNIFSNVLLGKPSIDETPNVVSKKGVLNAFKSLFKRRQHESNVAGLSEIPNPEASANEMPSISQLFPNDKPDKSSQPSPFLAQENFKIDYIHQPYSKSSNTIRADIHKRMTDEIRRGNYKIQIAPSDLVDFGGQRAFDLTHQLFIQQRGAFILFIDGRKNLDDVLSEYYDGTMTTRMILLHWVNSILTYCSADDSDIYPLIVFAVTHKDELSKAEQRLKSNEFTRQLTHMFSTHEYCDRIKYQQLFLINATDNNDSGVKSLKQFLVSAAFQQKSWGERMPMAWVPLELQLAEMRTNGIFIISLYDIHDLNLSNGDLALPDKQLQHFLRCQHGLGKIMYFDVQGLKHFVIVQPTAMVDILRSFITDKIFWPEKPCLHEILNTISQIGIIKKSDLFQLWEQDEFNKYIPTTKRKEFIAKVLIHLDILVEPKHIRETNAGLANSFIVPCMIKQIFSPMQFPSSVDNNKTIFLSYKLLKSALPNAMVYKLIGAVLNIWPLKKKDGILCLYDKAAVLEIDQNNDLYLTFKNNRVSVALAHSNSKYFISPDIASVIQETLTLTMNKVLQFYNSSFGQTNCCKEISQLFETEVGEICGEEICFTSLSDIKDKASWICMDRKEHNTKFPLYWIFDKKQTMCPLECTGLNTQWLDKVPEDRHLIRLARHIGRKFYEFIIYLGLTVVEWEDIEDNKNYADKLTQKFVALCCWKKNQLARNISPTFLDLSKALTCIDYSQHFLCQVFRERFTEVFALDNPRLQEIPDDSILKELSRNIGHRTLHLGVELGLDIPSIDNIVFRDYKDIFAQTFDVLLEWKSTSKIQPTVRTLMLALQYVDPRGFRFLQEHYAVDKPVKSGK